MTKGSNFWVIGGEFGSMNFHKLVEGSAQVQGPFKTRQGSRGCLALGLGREPPQGRRPLLDRGRAVAGLGLTAALEHDPEKWEPVFREDHAQTKLDRDA
ncbi:hypothetical protein ABIF78_007537 [Bradyrhizobium japonicum]